MLLKIDRERVARLRSALASAGIFAASNVDAVRAVVDAYPDTAQPIDEAVRARLGIDGKAAKVGEELTGAPSSAPCPRGATP